MVDVLVNTFVWGHVWMIASASASEFAKIELCQRYYSESLWMIAEASVSNFGNWISSQSFFKGFLKFSWKSTIPTNIYLWNVNNRNFRKRCKICSNLTIKTPKRRQWLCYGVFIVNFEHILHLFLVFVLLTLNK